MIFIYLLPKTKRIEAEQKKLEEEQPKIEEEQNKVKAVERSDRCSTM